MEHLDFLISCIKRYRIGIPITVTELTNIFMKEYPWEEGQKPNKKELKEELKTLLNKIREERIIPMMSMHKDIWYRWWDYLKH